MRLSNFIIALAVAACGSEQSAPPPGGHPALAATNMTGLRPLGMRNCPSRVAGATTQATNTPTGVDLTITAEAPAAREQIIRLAERHAAPAPIVTPGYVGAKAHNGMRGGPGNLGYCPIVHTDSTVTYEEVDGGVRIHLTATPQAVKQLQDMTARRMRALAPVPTS